MRGLPFTDSHAYRFALHREQGTGRYILEVGPKDGAWAPFIVAVPLSEKDAVKPEMWPGAAGHPQNWGALFAPQSGTDRDWAVWSAQNAATETMSYFIYCTQLPSRILFGVVGSKRLQYTIENPGKPNQEPKMDA